MVKLVVGLFLLVLFCMFIKSVWDDAQKNKKKESNRDGIETAHDRLDKARAQHEILNVVEEAERVEKRLKERLGDPDE